MNELPPEAQQNPAQQNPAQQNPAPSHTRLGGVLVLTAAVAAACSYGPGQTVTAPTTTTTPGVKPSEADKGMLTFAAKVEATAVELYTKWAALKFLAGNTAVTGLIGTFTTNHTAHLGALNSLLVRNGRKEVPVAVDPQLGPKLAPGEPTSAAQVLQFAANMEEILTHTATAMIGTFADPTLEPTFIGMAGADARQFVAAKLAIEPNADVVGAANVAPTKAIKPT